jgi:hypothetical protein
MPLEGNRETSVARCVRINNYMHARRFSCMLLGIWLAGSILMTFIAADSANTASRILRDHSAGAGIRIKSMGEDEARIMLGYPARLQARWWLEEWENVELVLGAAFFFFLLFATREGKLVLYFTLGIYAVVLFQRFFTLPQMLYLGGQMDFVPANVFTPERNQLTAVQTAFTGLEMFKVLLQLALGVYLIARSRRSSYSNE